MKYIIKTILMCFMLASVLTSCTSEFDKINTDQTVLSSSEIDASFAGSALANAQYRGLQHGGPCCPSKDDPGTWQLATMLHSMFYAHYTVGQIGWGPNTERYEMNDGWRDRLWLRFYSIAVPSLQTSFKAAEGDELATAVLKVWKVFMYQRITDHFGAIPYSQAGNGQTDVPYDSQEAIYADFFKLLDEAIAVLNSNAGKAVFSDSDLIFEGNVDKWKSFANTLKLRIAIRVSGVDPSNAKIKAEEAVASGVMTSSDQSAFINPNGSAELTNNMNIVSGWGEHRLSASMESTLKGYNDPRLQKWFSPAKSDSEYRGMPNGTLPAVSSVIGTDFNEDISWFSEPFQPDNGLTNPIPVMYVSEAYLLRAEGAVNGWNMNGTAEDLYNMGITESMNQWGITDAGAINTYINGITTPVQPLLAATYYAVADQNPRLTVPVKFDAATAKVQIAAQKYLALFPESYEAWADLRRTRINILYPMVVSDNPDVNRMDMISRVTFLPNEYTTNKTETEKAVTLLGGADNANTKMWWDVE